MKSKLITALISVALALGVWFYVVTVISPNSDKTFYNIKVEPVGEKLLNEQGLMITNIADLSTVTLHLEGSRVDLNKLSSDNINISMDVSKISEPGTHDLSYDIAFPGDVASNAITVLSKDPGSVKVYVEERISKTVPVHVNYSGKPATDYMADKENDELDVENVTVTGPKPVIDLITQARIDVDLNGRSESFSEKFTYTLCNDQGEPVDAQSVVTDVAQINLTLRVVRVKVITLDVNVIDGGGAEKADCVVISPGTIQVSGSDNLLEGLDVLTLDTVINLGEVTEDTVLTLPIKLPEGVTNETGVTEATVSISFPNLTTRTMTVKNIQVINVPAGMKVDLITQALEVQLRGPEEKLNTLTEADISVVVDFTATEEGTVKIKATIKCTDSQVGAVGSYTVSATVSKDTP